MPAVLSPDGNLAVSPFAAKMVFYVLWRPDGAPKNGKPDCPMIPTDFERRGKFLPSLDAGKVAPGPKCGSEGGGGWLSAEPGILMGTWYPPTPGRWQVYCICAPAWRAGQ